MAVQQIHVFGAAGSGTTTIGALLAQRLSIAHFDADDYFWQRTNPPYTTKNPPHVRVQELTRDMQRATGWVLSGSLVGWGDVFIPSFSLAVFVTLPQPLRMERLQIREEAHYTTRIAVGGDMHEAHRAFMAWAATYDDPDAATVRSRKVHEAWVQQLPCPVVRLENTELPVDAVRRVLEHVPSNR